MFSPPLPMIEPAIGGDTKNSSTVGGSERATERQRAAHSDACPRTAHVPSPLHNPFSLPPPPLLSREGLLVLITDDDDLGLATTLVVADVAHDVEALSPGMDGVPPPDAPTSCDERPIVLPSARTRAGRALVRSALDEFLPFHWKILRPQSRTKTSPWLSDLNEISTGMTRTLRLPLT